MFERWKAFLSQPRTPEKPREWEASVAESLNILNYYIGEADKAGKGENFQPAEHAKNIRTRVGNFRKLVLEKAGIEGSIVEYPKFIEVKLDSLYFYIPESNKLVKAKDQLIGSGGSMSSVIDFDNAEVIDETEWCLDKAILAIVITQLVDRLPHDSTRRILSATA